MFLTSSAPTSPMRQICAHARSSAISPDVVNGVCPVPVHTPFGEAHGRPKPRSYRPAIVCRPGVGRDLCAVRHWPIVDLRHADGGQFCPWCVLYGRSLCRRLHPYAWRKLLDLPDRGAGARWLVRRCRRAPFDTTALWPRNRLSAAADVRTKLRDG